MSDPEPNIEVQSLAGSATRLEATNSQIGNASQVVNSPGAVVSQNITQVHSSTGLSRNDLTFWALLALAVLVVVSRATINVGLPPVVGQLIAGGALAGMVWKSFEKIEGLLNDQTKFEIAVWLVGVKTADKVPWPGTFAKVFDRVFGEKHLSWKCFLRSALASYAVSLLVFMLTFHADRSSGIKVVSTFKGFALASLGLFALNSIPDYVSLLETRVCLRYMMRSDSPIMHVILILSDILFTLYFALSMTLNLFFEGVSLWSSGHPSPTMFNPVKLISVSAMFNGVWFLVWPAFLTSVWLWLYAGSGFLLKFAQRFDLGFQWFTAKFDIERRPLSAIGLVAGALVAVAYWGVACGTWLLGK